jgi:hypothetical protein
MDTYEIVRFFENGQEQEIIETGLSLDDAKEHCSDPATSSSTSTHSNPYGTEWFDGFRSE